MDVPLYKVNSYVEMNILGISGLPNCVAFKKKHFPYLEKRNFRIAQGFDSAAALISRGKVIGSAAEERFSREKTTEKFPVQAIQFCLNYAGLHLSDIDFIAYGFNYEPVKDYYIGEHFEKIRFTETYSRQSILRSFQQVFDYPDQKIVQVPHHLAHAASAWYLSGLPESLILVADGMGEIESLTVALGYENKIEILMQIPALHSLGILYSIFTLYLGFEFNQDEYKVMGLAPYGNSSRYLKEVMQLVHHNNNGAFSIPVLSHNVTLEEKETYSGALKILIDLFGNAREPDSEITQKHKDIAAALQKTLQNTLMHILKYYKQKTKQTNLCMAGGVALNCTANSYIRKSQLFKNIFIQPAAGDDGTALGAALYVARQHEPGLVFKKMRMPFLGPQFNSQEIKEVITHFLQAGQPFPLSTAAMASCLYPAHRRSRLLGMKGETLRSLPLRPPSGKESSLQRELLQAGYHLKEFSDFDILAREIAEKIAHGQIIALFQGRMELGPRALGNRSILADPRVATNKEKINKIIKQREDFRPFAPAVIAEHATQFFDIDESNISEYKYMLMVATVKEKYERLLPAVTHVDGSARVQVVFKSECLRFWKIISEFGNITGVPILLNTSFNVRGQPIVCTPQEALNTFTTINLDALVLENFLLEK